jgi:hypothetical protein
LAPDERDLCLDDDRRWCLRNTILRRLSVSLRSKSDEADEDLLIDFDEWLTAKRLDCDELELLELEW